jgi:hypothetical protein
MKKIIIVLISLFSFVFSTNAYYSNTFNSCETSTINTAYDYLTDWTLVKKYSYNTNTRDKLKICYYYDNWKKYFLDNWEYKVLSEKTWYKINYKKIFCDDWVTKTIFKWTKNIKMSCNFTVNWKKYVLYDWKTKIITTKYWTKTISQKFKCDNWKVEKISQWTWNKEKKDWCRFDYNNKNYKLEHNWFVTIKTYENDHLVYKKYICDNWNLKDYSLWRNNTTELTNNCRFIYRGKYYDLQNNWIKVFNTTIYKALKTKTFVRKYYCNNWVAKIY